MKIGFWSEHLCERGTSTALYDYASCNEKILGNKSVIFYTKNHTKNFPEYETIFNREFLCYPLDNFSDIDDIISKENIDALYLIKYGIRDNLLSKRCPNLVHAVFVKDPHGEKYAFISKFLSEKNGGDIPYIPHMINLENAEEIVFKETYRKELNIPDDAIVFGGYGGKDSFNIPFVHQTINLIVQEKENIYFLFMNFDKNTINHPRIIYMNPTINVKLKLKFINTCDAMIHARNIGETFGLAVGEFSSCNKPIITYYDLENNLPVDREHIRILKDKGIYYKNRQELLDIFRNFKKNDQNWNCYQEYNSKDVMTIFEKVFLNTITCEYNNKNWTLFLNDGISNHIIKSEGWEPHLTNLFKTLIRKGDTVCDIGANFGYHTLTMSECVGETGSVFAFEPQRIIHNLLVRNCNQNKAKNVTPLKMALSNENKMVNFTKIDWLKDKQNMGDSYIKNGANTEEVVCRKFDDLAEIGKYDLVKIDIQGCEVFCLEGMKNSIELYSPYIVIEIEGYTLERFGCNSKQLFDYIRSLNYTIFFIEYNYPSDHLCVPNHKLTEFFQRYEKNISRHTTSNYLNNNLENGIVHKIKF